MYNTLACVALLAYAVEPKAPPPRMCDDHPPLQILEIARTLPRKYQERLVNEFSFLSLGKADHDYYSFDNFDGVYNVLWHRAQGRPLPYPIDFEFGQIPQHR